MMRQEAILELIRLLYQAASGQEEWSSFLVLYSQAVRSPAAAVIVQDLSNQNGNVTASLGVDPYWEKLYEEHYCKENVWLKRGGHSMRPGHIVTGYDLGIEDNELASSEFYNDYLRPQGLFYAHGGVLTREGSVTSCLTTLRAKSVGDYGREEVNLLRILIPHLQTALRIHARLAVLENRLSAMDNALNRMPWGVLALRSNASIVWMNRAAERILGAGDGLLGGTDGLRAENNSQSKQLRNTIAAVAETSRGGMNPGAMVPISRPSGLRPFSLLIAPLPSARPWGFSGASVLVFVGDPEDRPEIGTELLERLYGFTPTEARMAQALLLGMTVEDYAEEARVTLNTARTHLKRILHKTGAARQAELIRFLLGSAARLRH
jgi:DNA-binding CsgD family transcriptional regulator/PAS domain-containing protein